MNGDFEEWIDEDDYMLAEHWGAMNFCATFGGQSSCMIVLERSDDAQSGNYAAKIMNSEDAGGDVTPGYMWSFEDMESFGHPFDGRPIALTGYYKFNQEGNDVGDLSVGLFHDFDEDDMDEGAEGLAGSGYLEFTSSVSGWTHFVIPINYTNEGEIERVVVTASSSQDDDNATAGTYLMLDNLHFAYTEDELEEPTSVLTSLELSTQVYPVPASTHVIVECPVDILGTRVLNMHGAVVPASFSGNQLNIGNLSGGVYMVELETAEGVFRKKIIKQ
ncbi:PCMD domain-containing protein [Cytophagaceae bacterium ABcell3]|nr:PCMD domain-containing protein [Cytophagaceae bacterium ABcell3]